jgi:dTMP kinase
MSLFITFEGPDGSGKTTQLQLLVRWLHEREREVVLTREPGGTAIGEQIRTVLHDPDNKAMDSRTEILLYAADRAQHVAQMIRPALANDKIVISDRYVDSTLAYQGYGREMDLARLRTITDFATGGLKPDLTFYLDILPEEGLQRRQLGGEEWNRMDAEALAFHRRVRAGYLALVEADQGRWEVIDADRPVEDVQAEIRSVVAKRLGIVG